MFNSFLTPDRIVLHFLPVLRKQHFLKMLLLNILLIIIVLLLNTLLYLHTTQGIDHPVGRTNPRHIIFRQTIALWEDLLILETHHHFIIRRVLANRNRTTHSLLLRLATVLYDYLTWDGTCYLAYYALLV